MRVGFFGFFIATAGDVRLLYGPHGTHIIVRRRSSGLREATMFARPAIFGCALVAMLFAPATAAAQGGPVAAYAFNETSGTTTADVSGNGIVGTLTNGATFAAGKNGNAVNLDGVNDFVNLGNSRVLRLTGSVTISAWINSTSFPVDDAAIVSKRGKADTGFQLDTTIDRGPRTIGFKISNTAGTASAARYGATTLQANTWYHVAGVYDAAARTLTVYLNGQPDNGMLVGTVPASQPNTNENVNVGQRPGIPGTLNFRRRVDDVRIYSRVLTAAEIQADMGTPVGGTAPPNTPPTISPITNQTTNEDTATDAIPFTVGDAETAAASLVVTAVSSNPALVPNGSIVLLGSGASRTVSIMPAGNQSGTATITVTVSDGQLTASSAFQVTVNPVNDPPTITSIANQTTAAGIAVGPLNFTVGDPETVAASLTVSGVSSNPTLVPGGNIVFGGSGGARTVTITPAANQTGTATITVAVNDGQLTASTAFQLTVTTGNTAPTITSIADQTVNEDATTAVLSFTVGDAETAAGSLLVSATSSNPVLVPTANILFGGSGAARTVKVTPAANQSGTTTITVTVSDGQLSASTAFQVAVTPVNDAPTITSIANQTTTVGTTVGPLSFTVGDAESAAGSLVVSGSSSDPTLVPDGSITFGGSGASRTVTITPAAGQTGAATITVTVSDGQASASTGFQLTVSAATPGLVAGYAFNESSGTTTADASGNGVGTLTNGAVFAAGKNGNAVSLDGQNDFVDLGNPAVLRITGSVTVVAWITATAFPFDDAAIVSKRSGADAGYQLDTTVDQGPRTVAFKISNATGTSNVSRYGSTSLTVNTWYHVAGVYDAAAQTLNVYLDGQLNNGVLVGTVPASQPSTSVNVQVGQRPGFPGTFNFRGRIDDVRIYSRALTAAEIQADMNTGVGGGSGGDVTPPIVTITTPTGTGSYITSTTPLTIGGTATDNVGVTQVMWTNSRGGSGAATGTDTWTASG